MRIYFPYFTHPKIPHANHSVDFYLLTFIFRAISNLLISYLLLYICSLCMAAECLKDPNFTENWEICLVKQYCSQTWPLKQRRESDTEKRVQDLPKLVEHKSLAGTLHPSSVQCWQNLGGQSRSRFHPKSKNYGKNFLNEFLSPNMRLPKTYFVTEVNKQYLTFFYKEENNPWFLLYTFFCALSLSPPCHEFFRTWY